ncbi:MAG: GLPGLI family protein [Gemmatimonadetes bacterium]|nr:GLPGLI family protein [Gemmatimonadota bacterium]MXX73343.1 GLPGLI family protein [Gemmatimonadota bacterium]MYC93094.1 GLPGLI family protein [Gemmatimonadota bacterium]MYG34364.1 GLPGLI family protein [Gemmatimonadota bacterium]
MVIPLPPTHADFSRFWNVQCAGSAWRWRWASLLRLIGPAALAVAAPASADAQGGTITYSRSTIIEVDAPEDMAAVLNLLAQEWQKSFLLHFDPSSSLMIPGPEVEGENPPPALFPMTHNNLDALVDMFEHQATSPENVLAYAYSDSGGAVAVRGFDVFRTEFRMDHAGLDAEWQITDDRRMHLSYQVTRATATLDGGEVVAWFAPDIPVPSGPALFGGLPGMILVLALNGGNTVYAATAVSLDGVDNEIVPPENEERLMTQDEYDSFVSDEIRDMRRQFRRLRNQGPHLEQCALARRNGRLSLSCFDPPRGIRPNAPSSLPQLHHQMAFLADPNQDEAVFDRVALPYHGSHVRYPFAVEVDTATADQAARFASGCGHAGVGHQDREFHAGFE